MPKKVRKTSVEKQELLAAKPEWRSLSLDPRGRDAEKVRKTSVEKEELLAAKPEWRSGSLDPWGMYAARKRRKTGPGEWIRLLQSYNRTGPD